MAEIAWDLDLLQAIINHYKILSDALQQQKARTETLQKQAGGNWQSEAGRMYAERINDDIASIDDLLGTFSELSGKVAEAKKTYASGESDIHTALINALTNLSIPF